MDTIESYIPLPKVKPFHQSRQRYKILLGGLGAGKSRAVCEDVIDDHMAMPGLITLVARKYNEDLEDTTMKVFYEETNAKNLCQEVTDSGFKCKMNNGEIIFKGLYTRSKARITKLGSYRLGKVAGDEVSEWSEEDFGTLQGRLRQENVSHRDMVMATNPPNIDHWIHKRFVDNKGPEYGIWKVSIYDNAENLPEDYIRNLEQDYKDNPSWLKRFVHGDFGFISYGHPVYKGFNENLHVADLVHNTFKPILRGWDFGWHRPCVSFCQFDNDDRFNILKTNLGDKIYLEDYAPKIIKLSNELYPGCKFLDFCDIAGTHKSDVARQTSVQILNSHGVYPRYMYTGVMKGVENVQKKLGTLMGDRPGIVVDRQNRYMIEIFSGGYYYAKTQEGKYEEEPCKDGFYEHGADTVRYILNFFYSNASARGKKIRVQEPSFRAQGNNLHLPDRYNRNLLHN